jgi:hypothetical protein
VLLDGVWRERSGMQVSDENAAAVLDQEPEGVVAGQNGVLPIGNAAIAHFEMSGCPNAGLHQVARNSGGGRKVRVISSLGENRRR